MKPINLESIHKSFEIQAQGFESDKYNFIKKEYLAHTVEKMQIKESDCVLEVAAGTCVCGREIAPHVRHIICMDATSAMLEVGKKEAEQAGLENISFVKGYAEELHFLDASFDVVISRLAFHHFIETHIPFQEMVRVLKPKGKFVMIDMEAASEPLRATKDEIETLRDFSHVKNLSSTEMEQLFEEDHLTTTFQEKVQMPNILENWMELTKTPEEVRHKITELMQDEVSGGSKTGFEPYLKDGSIYFNQR